MGKHVGGGKEDGEGEEEPKKEARRACHRAECSREGAMSTGPGAKLPAWRSLPGVGRMRP